MATGFAPIAKTLIAAISFIAVGIGAAGAHDVRQIGDGRYSNVPKEGYLFSCQSRFNTNAPGASGNGPWIRGKSYDPDDKPTIDGAVTWPNARIEVTREGDTRIVSANNLPTHPTGNFPVSRSDDAFRYDRNPNRIRGQGILLRLPAEPVVAAQPSCVPMGMIGFTLTGGALYNALDARGRDAPAHEILDKCGGHPQRNGQYHYHDLAPCLPSGRDASGHSELIGYALDGFGIFGPYEAADKEMTNAGLDGCHGHVGPVIWDGEERTLYHYHLNDEYPYSIGCFRGAPVSTQRLATVTRAQTPMDRQGEGQGGRRGDPLAAVARDLGIDVNVLRAAVGPPPPDIKGAARKLGVSEQKMREAFRLHRPQ
jgi:hypothetical protein